MSSEIAEKLSNDLKFIAGQDLQHAFVAIHQRKPLDEVVICGNRQGLIKLASYLLELAVDGSEGSHRHLDQHSGADEADVPIVFAKQAAPWERSNG